jgi:hypothetical protein
MYHKQMSLLAALLAAPLVHGHYIFSQLIVNGQPVGTDYTYMRKNTNSYMPSFTADVINSPDLICNKGANKASSKTYDVKAGDKVGFKLWFNEFIEHPGPAFVYMSKAPGDVASYDGSGDWFKAYENGYSGSASVDKSWGTWQKDRIEFTIPADIPNGEYLVRVSCPLPRKLMEELTRKVPPIARTHRHPRSPRRQSAVLHGMRAVAHLGRRQRLAEPARQNPGALQRSGPGHCFQLLGREEGLHDARPGRLERRRFVQGHVDRLWCRQQFFC